VRIVFGRKVFKILSAEKINLCILILEGNSLKKTVKAASKFINRPIVSQRQEISI
jgi:hypothetical protein